MATRVRRARTMTRKPTTGSRRKKKCELGTTCPYQHEGQHQQEFSHEADGDGKGKGGKNNPKGTLVVHTSGALKGTGHSGRKLAVAADRRRVGWGGSDQGNKEGEGTGTCPGSRAGESAREDRKRRAMWIDRMQQQQDRAAMHLGGQGETSKGAGSSVPHSQSRQRRKLPQRPQPHQQREAIR
ncbi:unnamed protein product, partial [Discosporangium mesarthrocarpum]